MDRVTENEPDRAPLVVRGHQPAFWIDSRDLKREAEAFNQRNAIYLFPKKVTLPRCAPKGMRNQDEIIMVIGRRNDPPRFPTLIIPAGVSARVEHGLSVE